MKDLRKWIFRAGADLAALRRRLAGEQRRKKTGSANHDDQRKTLLWHPSIGALGLSLALLASPATSAGQEGPAAAIDAQPATISIYVWEAASPLPEDAGGAQDPRLSRDFAATGTKALFLLHEWQRHIAYSIRGGYPLSESWIAMDRDRADYALRLAALAASNDADRIALRSLLRQFDNLEQWSNGLIEANRNLRLAKYYTSSSELENDSLYQKATSCGDYLADMLSSGQLTEDRSCR